MNIFVSLCTNDDCARCRRDLQDLTEYTESLQAQYGQHFCPTTAQEHSSENRTLIRSNHKEWDGAFSDSQQAVHVPLSETVQTSNSETQPCVDLKKERRLRGEDCGHVHARINPTLPEDNVKEESDGTEEEDQTGDGLEEKADEHSGEEGDEEVQGEETERSSEEEMYLRSTHEDDSE